MIPNTDKVASARSKSKTWLILGCLGLAAALAGSVLPQFFLGDTPAPAHPPTPAVIKEAPPKQDAGQANNLLYTPPAWPEAPSPGPMLARLGVGTVVVLALCVGSLWFGKRWLLRGLPPTKPGGEHLRLIDAIPLGNRCSVYLLQTGVRQVLVGVDGSGLKALVTLPETFENALNDADAANLDGVPEHHDSHA